MERKSRERFHVLVMKKKMNLLCMTATCFHLKENLKKNKLLFNNILLNFIQKNLLVIDAILIKPPF